jgi:deoxyadenosine/deoxycytidine kinase
MSKNIIISIEGNIGSGKSTLLKNLQSYYENKNIIFLREPVDEWESIVDIDGNTMLSKFYADQEKYSFPFQMMAYISRLALLKESIEKNPNSIIITERSLYTDKFVFAKMLYDSGKIELVNYQIYLKWFDTFANDYPINKIIYVCADPDICSERIVKRSRNGENNIPLDYLKSCHSYHENMINLFMDCSKFNCEKLQIDGNVDIFENENYLKETINSINKFINK